MKSGCIVFRYVPYFVNSNTLLQTYLFVNDGKGKFTSKLLHGISNEDFGSSGISMHDLDRDGDLDILYTNGDAFDYQPPRPRPWPAPPQGSGLLPPSECLFASTCPKANRRFVPKVADSARRMAAHWTFHPSAPTTC